MAKLDKKTLDGFKEIKNAYAVNDIVQGTKLSEGAFYVMTEGNALGLISAIANAQATERADFQIWRLTVQPDKNAELTCKDRHGHLSTTKSFRNIDFPLPEIVLCVAKPVGGSEFMIMLPREANNYYGDKIAPVD